MADTLLQLRASVESVHGRRKDLPFNVIGSQLRSITCGLPDPGPASAVAVCAEIGHWAAKGYISKALASIWLEPYRLISADISNVNCLDVFQCAVGGGTAGGRGGAGRGQGGARLSSRRVGGAAAPKGAGGGGEQEAENAEGGQGPWPPDGLRRGPDSIWVFVLLHIEFTDIGYR